MALCSNCVKQLSHPPDPFLSIVVGSMRRKKNGGMVCLDEERYGDLRALFEVQYDPRDGETSDGRARRCIVNATISTPRENFGQAEVSFCSFACLRKWMNDLVDQIEEASQVDPADPDPPAYRTTRFPINKSTYDEQDAIRDYVILNFKRLMTPVERRVWQLACRREAAERTHYMGDRLAKWLNAESPEVIRASEVGRQAFRSQVIDRLFRDYHGGVLAIPRCPKCKCVVHEPTSKACLWCGHDWYQRKRKHLRLHREDDA